MIPLRRSSVFAIRTPWSRGRPYASGDRWSSSVAQMAYKTLPTLSLQGKVSNDVIVCPTQKQLMQYMGRQVCLVTGAAQGLGNEFCRAFMRS